jgi:hypothetical protein
MEQWRLESGLPLRARWPKSFAPFETRPPLLSSATRRRITIDGDVPGFPGYAKLHGTWVHPAFGFSKWFSQPFRAFVASRLANTVVTSPV